MNLFDILGPVMVGPSSSHTAGAVRIGLAARRLLGEGTPKSAEITLFGSFAATGRGHGTDRALIAGLLGYKPDDERIADSYAWAKGYGMDVHFEFSKRAAEHPNTATIKMTGQSGKQMTMTACSLGGGRIMVTEFNGLQAKFSCDLPTLIVQNTDQPGRVGIVTSLLAKEKINIATLHVYRDHPGGNAVMIIEMDKPASKAIVESLSKAEGIKRVITVGGCQYEIGTASAMAAAALCYLGGGDAEAICHAAALAIKSLLGLVCDPIAGLVEVPCIKRNASGAMVAMCCADMALAGIRSAVPPDEVIMAMKDVGDKMDVSLRETGLGGIAGTPSGVKIADELRLAYGHLNG